MGAAGKEGVAACKLRWVDMTLRWELLVKKKWLATLNAVDGCPSAMDGAQATVDRGPTVMDGAQGTVDGAQTGVHEAPLSWAEPKAL